MLVFRTHVPTHAPVIHVLIVNKYRYIINDCDFFFKFMNFEHVFVWMLFQQRWDNSYLDMCIYQSERNVNIAL